MYVTLQTKIKLYLSFLCYMDFNNCSLFFRILFSEQLHFLGCGFSFFNIGNYKKKMKIAVNFNSQMSPLDISKNQKDNIT